MAKPTLDQLQASVLDPMLSDNFLLDIPDVPGGGNAQALRIQCQSATKPGVTINAVEVQVFGHTLEFAGNKTFNHDMTIEYVENRQAEITTALESWAQLIRQTATQTGAYKKDYARSARFYIYDNMGVTVRDYTVYGLWPSVVPDISFNGTSSSIINLSTTFKFDYYTLTGQPG